MTQPTYTEIAGAIVARLDLAFDLLEHGTTHDVAAQVAAEITCSRALVGDLLSAVALDNHHNRPTEGTIR